MSTEHRASFQITDIDDDGVPPELEEAESREIAKQESDTPVRHLRIDWPSASIKGRYAIGASVPDMRPPLYDMPSHKDMAENASSAVFLTKSSPINATVHVLHGQGQSATQALKTMPPPEPVNHLQLLKTVRNNTVLIEGRSSRNSVCLHVPAYVGRRPLHIKAHTQTGNVTVILPHSFNGVIQWHVETGTFHMSPNAASHCQRLDSHQSKRHGTAKFVVDPDLPAWMTAHGRRGDICELYANTGRLYVCMSGEKKPSGAQGCVIC
ncbi:hypothetical protein ACI68E_004029 [Malassezia pachydermatis]|uniref:DUF7330 domain-containing protein n=1 Tax=Malassezia pachydermatis TaxID=77020 RepID=A0A0M8MJ37_9BASI|nr:hypothetical protein Malapachy_2845 [Malassezia pachydermatis]KOS12558.1 hypothetical protein Malapachy_2845 [Malassezia pachydermatis]